MQLHSHEHKNFLQQPTLHDKQPRMPSCLAQKRHSCMPCARTVLCIIPHDMFWILLLQSYAMYHHSQGALYKLCRTLETSLHSRSSRKLVPDCDQQKQTLRANVLILVPPSGSTWPPGSPTKAFPTTMHTA